MRYQIFAAAVAMFICWWLPAYAQSTNEVSQPALSGPSLRHEAGALRFLEGVPEETRERFLAAREKALEDPKLQQLRKNAERANKDFYRAMRGKMLQIDPGLADLVRKRSMQFKARRVWWQSGGLASLSDQEREKLLNVLVQVEEDPAVQAAEKKRWDASSAAELKAAEEAYRNALRAAMMKLDSSIAPIVDKLDAPRNAVTTPAESPTKEQEE